MSIRIRDETADPQRRAAEPVRARVQGRAAVSVRIRDAILEDVPAVARVHVQSWRESYGDFLSSEALAGLSVEERARMWTRTFDDPDPRARFLVAEEPDGEIVGFVRGGPYGPMGAVSLGTDAEIYAIYLLRKAQRKGIGRQLMTGVFDHLSDQGFASVGLWVLTGNLGARRFYEAMGGRAGPEQPMNLSGETVMEIAYRFEPIPR